MSNYLAHQMAGLRQQDHSCLIYETEEEHVRAVVLFIAEGLRKGERCGLTGNGHATGHIISALEGAGIDLKRERERKALMLDTPGEAYLRSARFDPEEQFGYLSGLANESLADGFAGMRHTGEMGWALGPEQGCDRLMEYEAKLNDLLAGLSMIGLCRYDRRQFSPEIIRDAIRTHPLVVLGDEVCSNLLYEPPELFLNGHSADRRVEWMMSRLRGTKPVARGATIMVVDDDSEIRSGMRHTLEAMGYRVVKGEDEMEALEVGQREHPGLILTNTDLRWLDELLIVLRQDAQLRFVPVVAIYTDRPDDFSEDRILVLDHYSELEDLLPA
jgi:CheY-like chemotaxis protein